MYVKKYLLTTLFPNGKEDTASPQRWVNLKQCAKGPHTKKPIGTVNPTAPKGPHSCLLNCLASAVEPSAAAAQ